MISDRDRVRDRKNSKKKTFAYVQWQIKIM